MTDHPAPGPDHPAPCPDHRGRWRVARIAIEEHGYRSHVRGPQGRIGHFWWMPVLEWSLKAVGLHQRGQANAGRLRRVEVDLEFPDLPPAFDGYRILQVSDMHLDAIPGHERTIATAVSGLDADLTVWTGDYRAHHGGASAHLEEPLQRVAAACRSPDMADTAARLGYSLYLCGHTHGGQIGLPGGRAVLTLGLPRAHVAGLWGVGGMIGYTSTGAGTSGVPVRYHIPGEVTLFTLRRP